LKTSPFEIFIHSSENVFRLKEKIQDVAGLPIFQVDVYLPSQKYPLADDYQSLLSLNFKDHASIEVQHRLKYPYLHHSQLNQVIPEALKEHTKDPLVASLLGICIISPNLQAQALKQIEELNSADLLDWAKDIGTSLIHRFSSPQELFLTTPQSAEILKGKISRFSRDLIFTPTSSKSKLDKEIAQVKLLHRSYEDHLNTVSGPFSKKKIPGKANTLFVPDDLVALRLFTLPSNEVRPTCFDEVTQYLSSSEGEKDKAEKHKEKEKEKEKEKSKEDKEKPWKHLISHLCSAIAGVKGGRGYFYRGSPTIPHVVELLQPGSVVTMTNFTSCLHHIDAARKFAEGRLLYEIFLPTEFGCYTKEVSALGLESELILPPFTSFKVISTERDHEQCQHFLKLECLGVLPSPIAFVPSSSLSAEEEEAKQKMDYFLAAHEGNAPFFIFNPQTTARLARERNELGENGLHVASRHAGNEATISVLLAYGANIDAQDNQGHTPLHVAIRAKNKRCAKVLVQKGASCEIKNAEGRTPPEENPDFFSSVVSKTKKSISHGPQGIRESSTSYELKKSPKKSSSNQVKKSESFHTLGGRQGQEKGQGQDQAHQTLSSRHGSSSSSLVNIDEEKREREDLVAMRADFLTVIAQIEKKQRLTKEQTKQIRKKVMKEDISILAAFQAYRDDEDLLLDTLLDYLD